jgi:hypothetical protein
MNHGALVELPERPSHQPETGTVDMGRLRRDRPDHSAASTAAVPKARLPDPTRPSMPGPKVPVGAETGLTAPAGPNGTSMCGQNGLVAADPPADWRQAVAWDARGWWDHYHERSATLEHHGGLRRSKAERWAFRECLQLWLAVNVPAPCQPDRCAWCGGAIPPRGHGAVPLLRVVEPESDHLWLHERCLDAFRCSREALARNFLAACSIGEPLV